MLLNNKVCEPCQVQCLCPCTGSVLAACTPDMHILTLTQHAHTHPCISLTEPCLLPLNQLNPEPCSTPKGCTLLLLGCAVGS
jgi:hypothetical protein